MVPYVLDIRGHTPVTSHNGHATLRESPPSATFRRLVVVGFLGQESTLAATRTPPGKNGGSAVYPGMRGLDPYRGGS